MSSDLWLRSRSDSFGVEHPSGRLVHVSEFNPDQKAELHRTIWKIANDLRGSVDGWDFKQYVLGMLFYRYISENLTAYLNDEERRAGLNPEYPVRFIRQALGDW